MIIQTSDPCAIYEAVGEVGEAVSGAVTAVYVGKNQSDVNRIEIVTDDFMYSRGEGERVQASDRLTIEIKSEDRSSHVTSSTSFDPDTLERELERKIEKHKSIPTVATGEL